MDPGSGADRHLQRPVPTAAGRPLRLLAQKPGITIDGPVTDRAGRAGVAVSTGGQYAGLSARHVLIIDPATGMILGAEEKVLEANGVLLAEPPPAPAHFMLVLRSTPAAGLRPTLTSPSIARSGTARNRLAASSEPGERLFQGIEGRMPPIDDSAAADIPTALEGVGPRLKQIRLRGA